MSSVSSTKVSEFDNISKSYSMGSLLSWKGRGDCTSPKNSDTLNDSVVKQSLEIKRLNFQLSDCTEKCNQLQKELTEAQMKIRMAANREAELNAQVEIFHRHHLLQMNTCKDCAHEGSRPRAQASVDSKDKHTIEANADLDTIKRERNEYRALAEERLGIIQRYEQRMKHVETKLTSLLLSGDIQLRSEDKTNFAVGDSMSNNVLCPSDLDAEKLLEAVIRQHQHLQSESVRNKVLCLNQKTLIDQMTTKLEENNKECNNLTDKVLRMQTDYDNVMNRLRTVETEYDSALLYIQKQSIEIEDMMTERESIITKTEVSSNRLSSSSSSQATTSKGFGNYIHLLFGECAFSCGNNNNNN